MFSVTLIVKPKPGVRDPQGAAVQEALSGLGYSQIAVHSVGRVLNFDLAAENEPAARKMIDDMCQRVLVNPNLETFEVSLKKS